MINQLKHFIRTRWRSLILPFLVLLLLFGALAMLTDERTGGRLIYSLF